MEAQTKIEISDAEWEVMRVTWTLGHVTSSQMAEIMAEKMGWKTATVKTLLGRLIKKGALRAEKHGRAFTYYPTVDEQPSMDEAVTTLFGHLCQMRVGQTLTDLVTQLTLSQTDIENLQATLAQKQATAPVTVDCDCLPGDQHC
ncbi:CopY/TcrY family copper transport repressor [Lactiplantibacillus mudanjiangensis]|uniref:CopY/TcrY family copper transport repressor [Lactobacillus sp.] n=1 Tax=Lactiplantibacillus mudanjiangensis TaxID=1296538 RepID=A0A660DYG6_9LACO|nr:CopY/TcrY family copper transport repressor [Lactiplantibacillus mudanjiangensis]VDG21334.1 CopY/TcrY family copper transport repressor [Lactobacillus sp.] [Lactiplantibacillus mudanjiangensis]VDG23588.1 CopY/TcrY family copper transport repressor [Lactobacillus sp.] [Lactiplantibacillus mudanjiangensis]VDG28818.1 CopY/TcrY family copper transport repressor [Lactobacillus sp.] [Lactiplantibacillus mudanjiangensis]VDG32168.1 CopY/TcrY family copper transport repressor [Lactobacillus sp.] [Lac